MAARLMSTTPPATSRAETSFTGSGNEKRRDAAPARTGRPSVITAMSVPPRCLCGLERALEVPHAGEVVEGPADDLARPVEPVGAGGGVVRPLRAAGVAGPATARLGRALVEVLAVPRRGEGAEVTAEARARQ